MARPSQHYDPPSELYSNLETVYHSPNAPPKADTGPQTYYTGDNGYEAKEVYNSSYPVVGKKGWKKRRICGMSMLTFIVVIAIVLIAALAGGVAGGVLGSREKDPPPAQAIVATPSQSVAASATTASSSVSDSASTGTSNTESRASSASSTSTNAPYPTPEIPSDWWHSIENSSPELNSFALTNLYKPSLGGNLKLQTYAEVVDEYMEQYYQHWQFYAITPKHRDSSIVRSNPHGVTALYLLAARIPGQETLLVLNSDDSDTFTAGTNTTAVRIRLDMKVDDGDEGRFWFIEKIATGEVGEVGMRIYNYKIGRGWWMAGEAGVELGSEGAVYMTSETTDGSEVWVVKEREFIKPEYDWIV